MAFFKWNNTFSVGVASIDDQHKILINMINDFYDNLKNRTNNENISILINEMKKYAQVHFDYEESYMLKFNYQDFDLHQKQHHIFASKVKDFEEKFNNGTLILSFEITSFLKEWLKHHILVEDKKYTTFFIEKGVK